eukprot:tig00000711_g3435.t1
MFDRWLTPPRRMSQASLPLADAQYASLPLGEAGHAHEPIAPQHAEFVRETGFARGVTYRCGTVVHSEDMDYVRAMHQPQHFVYAQPSCGCAAPAPVCGPPVVRSAGHCLAEMDAEGQSVPAAELDSFTQLVADDELVAADDFGVASLPIGEYAMAAHPVAIPAAKPDSELIRLTAHGGGIHTSCRDHAVHSWEMDALREAFYNAKAAGVASCGVPMTCNTCGGGQFVARAPRIMREEDVEGATVDADAFDALPAESAAGGPDADLAGEAAELEVQAEEVDAWI